MPSEGLCASIRPCCAEMRFTVLISSSRRGDAGSIGTNRALSPYAAPSDEGCGTCGFATDSAYTVILAPWTARGQINWNDNFLCIFRAFMDEDSDIQGLQWTAMDNTLDVLRVCSNIRCRLYTCIGRYNQSKQCNLKISHNLGRRS